MTTTTRAFGQRTRILTMALTIVIGMIMILGPARPAEAAQQASAPTVNCTDTFGKYGTIRVNHGLRASGTTTEYASIAYTIQRWNGSTWVKYTSFAYATTLYPVGSGIVELPPVHKVIDGFYRVNLAMVWNQSGTQKSWAGTVQWYHDYRGTFQTDWCWA